MSNRFFRLFSVCCLILGSLLGFTASSAVAQTTAFTYQGKLVDNGNLANTSYDMQFKLFDALSGGNQIAILTFDGIGTNPPAVSVTNGIFAVTLDFGTCSPTSPCFDGSPRFLEIAVKPHGSGSYTTLTPRQPITATPYAMKTMNLTFNGPYNDGTFIFSASNTFAGEGAGLNTTPNPNPANVPGKLNAFYGAGAGQANTTGNRNAFFGAETGQSNTTGSNNTFFGFLAGQANTISSGNAFFGSQAGQSNTGGGNAFFGNAAGVSNTSGNNNAFFGRQAGAANTIGNQNAFFGASAGASTSSGGNNAFFGANAGVQNTTGNQNAFFGFGSGANNDTGNNNAFFGHTAGVFNITGSGNTFIGITADFLSSDLTGDNNTLLGYATHISSSVSNATAIGALASVTQSNSLVLGSINGVNGATADTNVGIGTTAPADRLHVNGIIRVATLGVADTTTTLCRNSLNQIATCNSSSLRYKTNITAFTGGLDVVRQLRPIYFTWKQSGIRDLGFGAEEVAKVEPLFTFTNEQGQIEGVKYDRINVALVNAVKELAAENDTLKQKLAEQQTSAAAQQQQLQQQQQEIIAIKKLLCQYRCAPLRKCKR